MTSTWISVGETAILPRCIFSRYFKTIPAGSSSGSDNGEAFWKRVINVRTCHEGIRGSRGVSPLILNINTRWNWLVSLKLRSLYSLWKSSRYRLNMSLNGTKKWSGLLDKRLLPLLEVEARTGKSVAQSIYRLRWPDSYCILFRDVLCKTEINVRTETCIFGLCNALSIVGARGGTLYWGTALQAGRSSVRFPIVPLAYFIDIIFPALGSTQTLTEMSTRNISWGKCDQQIGLGSWKRRSHGFRGPPRLLPVQRLPGTAYPSKGGRDVDKSPLVNAV